jgi:cell division protein FtsW (lipid II flippase)
MWRCPKCNENIEDQFDSCWNCTSTELREPPPNDSVLVWLYPAVSLISLFFISLLAEFFRPSRHHDSLYFAFGRAVCGFMGSAICIWMFFGCPLRHWFMKFLTLLLLIPAVAFGVMTVGSFVSHVF